MFLHVVRMSFAAIYPSDIVLISYVLHLLLLAIVGTFVAHVQVSAAIISLAVALKTHDFAPKVVTRLVCGCPAFYWAAAGIAIRPL
jgi:hypothetical protein